jgi:hypothetical protein
MVSGGGDGSRADPNRRSIAVLTARKELLNLYTSRVANERKLIHQVTTHFILQAFLPYAFASLCVLTIFVNTFI